MFHLFFSDEKGSAENLEFLVKIILTCSKGRLRINNTSPDRQFTLKQYLFDHEHLIFDFSRLNDQQKSRFISWLITPYSQNSQTAFLNDLGFNECRGFTAEAELTWWGKLRNELLHRKTDYFQIAANVPQAPEEIKGIDLGKGHNGLLIGFRLNEYDQSNAKYSVPEVQLKKAIGNVKRVFITEHLIDELENTSIAEFNAEHLLNQPHPWSIVVPDEKKRYQEMGDYRRINRFDYPPFKLAKLARWLRENEVHSGNEDELAAELEPIISRKRLTVFQKKDDGELLVVEKKPPSDILVFSGGGSRIFAFIGVLKAFEQTGIKPRRFAGSSAGAIVSALSYLGYTSEEIYDFFKTYDSDKLVFLQPDIHGLADSQPLKAALDYMIIRRVKEICTRYNAPMPEGKITFALLHALKNEFPDCGIGDELTITGTNKSAHRTVYYSNEFSPDMEFSEATRISANMPGIYKDILIDGERYGDGGILSNFPTEIFIDDHSTLLESEYGNNLRIIAVQINNGTENNTLYRITDKVYRESLIANILYSFITGVRDPVASFVGDRLKLRKYALQSIVVDVPSVSSANFSVSSQNQEKMIQGGLEATHAFIDLRYKKDKHGKYKNKEWMYNTFSSFEELLTYCCYRNDKRWFKRIKHYILANEVQDKEFLMARIDELQAHYFTPSNPSSANKVSMSYRDYLASQEGEKRDYALFLALYGVINKMPVSFAAGTNNSSRFKRGRFDTTLDDPLGGLSHFTRINGTTHVLFHCFLLLIRQLEIDPVEEIFELLNKLALILETVSTEKERVYFHPWRFTLGECARIINTFMSHDETETQKLCLNLKKIEASKLHHFFIQSPVEQVYRQISENVARP